MFRYGDITPNTIAERYFAIGTMLAGTVMYGWLVATIASALSNSMAASQSFCNSVLIAKHYFAINDVRKFYIFTDIYLLI